MKKILIGITSCFLFTSLVFAEVTVEKIIGDGGFVGSFQTDVTAIGKTTVSSSGEYYDANRIYRALFTADKTVILKKGYYYLKTASSWWGDFKMVVVDSAGVDDYLAFSDVVVKDDMTGNSWNEFTFSGANQITLEKGHQYGICIWSSSSWYSGATGSSGIGYDNWSFGSNPSVGSNWNWDATFTASNTLDAYLTGDEELSVPVVNISFVVP